MLGRKGAAMADPIKARLTGFTHGMERHGAKVVPHDADTMRSIQALSANGITGATLVSRMSGAEFAVVDGVRVYKCCERDAMDFAIRRKPIPQHMQYEYGVPYQPPEAEAASPGVLGQADVDALLAQVQGVAKTAATDAVPAQPSGDAASTAPAPAAMPAAHAERIIALTTEITTLRKAVGDLGAKNASIAAELAAAKAVIPNLAENVVTIEIPGFGAVALVVDYLHEQGNALVIGTLRSKKRAQAIPKPRGEATSVRFSATIHDKHYDLVAFSDLRFPVGDLDVQAFIITNTIGGA